MASVVFDMHAGLSALTTPVYDFAKQRQGLSRNSDTVTGTNTLALASFGMGE